MMFIPRASSVRKRLEGKVVYHMELNVMLCDDLHGVTAATGI
jgi:hypothetical protein